MHATQYFSRPLAALYFVAALAAYSHAADAPSPGLVTAQPPSGRFVKTDRGYMIPYKQTIPGSEVAFLMEPIPGGKFLLGSPDKEPGHKPDESPQIEITVEPFWMGAYEITWAEYKQYMSMYTIFKKMTAAKAQPLTDSNKHQIVTAPSSLYDPTFTFKLGSDPQQPAVTMSQFAAKQYTKWLSGLTGQLYRLPAESEWEYACRAGAKTAYFFGDNPGQLGDYAWYYDNSGERMHLVGQKKPNPFGLYDIHGNVGEWVLDEYTKDGYEAIKNKSPLTATAAIAWPKKLFPRVVRGGGWEDNASGCRSASRRKSDDDDWREEDPNFPQSPWWFTSQPALSVGFRLLRPLSEPPASERAKFWDADIEQIQNDVDQRIDSEGRGARALAIPQLLESIKQITDAP